MNPYVKYCCNDMEKGIRDGIIYYSEVYDEYGIPYYEDNVSIQTIQHCPWCGIKLPDSQRIAWFEELEQLGYDNPLTQDVPIEYKSACWRVK